MEAEKQSREPISRISRPRSGGGNMSFVDNRPQSRDQTRLVESIQKKQNKFHSSQQVIQKLDGVDKGLGVAGGLGVASAGIGTGFLVGGPVGALIGIGTGFLVGGPVGALIGGGIGLISGSLLGGITGRWLGSQVRPITKLNLIGISHENGRSYACVKSEADLGSPQQNVVYEIKWDQNVVPGGNHLDQNNIEPGTYVVDRSSRREAVGDRNSGIHGYFDDNNKRDNRGLHFKYTDGIEQRELNNGSWYFRLRVVEGNNTLSSSEIRINWNH